MLELSNLTDIKAIELNRFALFVNFIHAVERLNVAGMNRISWLVMSKIHVYLK